MKEKAIEADRIRMRQERSDDVRAEQDALRAKRAQEQSEREWRKREEMRAVQKAQNEEMLRKARIKQQEEKEHLLAIEANRDRADFENMLKSARTHAYTHCGGSTDKCTAPCLFFINYSTVRINSEEMVWYRWYSRVSRPTRHSIGHFGDGGPEQ